MIFFQSGNSIQLIVNNKLMVIICPLLSVSLVTQATSPQYMVNWWTSVTKNTSTDILKAHSRSIDLDVTESVISSSIATTIEAVPVELRSNFDSHSDNHSVLFVNSLDFTRLKNVESISSWNWNELLIPRLDSPGINYKDCIESIKMQVAKETPRALIFVLSGLEVKDPPMFPHYMVNQLKYFISLIQFIGNLKECKVILIVQTSYKSPVKQWWSRAFGLTLLSSSLGNAGRASIIRVTVKDSYTSEGPTSTCSDMEIILRSILVQDRSTVTEIKSCPLRYPPVKAGKNVIISTYFSNGKYSQYKHQFKSNSFRFMRKWFLSGKRIGASLAIFHDNLGKDFQERAKKFYGNIEFISVKPTDFKGKTPNDGRFFIWYNYLLRNPDIANVIATDIRDVAFLTDPFEVMKEIGSYVYLGSDNPFHMVAWTNNGVRQYTQKCYGKNLPDLNFFLKHEPFYNAGVVGGTRNAVMNFFNTMMRTLELKPSNMNCNMGTYSYVASKYFWNSSFTGYPFQSAFKIGLPGPTNVAIKHKVYAGNNVYDDSMD